MSLAVVIVAWGSTFTAMEIALETSPALVFVGLRCLMGGAVVGIVAWATSRAPRLRDCWRTYLVLTWWNVVAFLGLQTLAVRELPSGQAAVLIYLQPILVSVLASWQLDEPINLRKALGLLTGLAGLVLVAGGSSSGVTGGIGVTYALLGALAWAIGTVAFKRRHTTLEPLWAVAIPFVTGGLGLASLGLIVEGPPRPWTLPFVSAMAYCALVGTALAWWIWLRLVGSGEASRASVHVFLVPVVATVLGIVVLDEAVRTPTLLGSLLVVMGILLVTRSGAGTAETARDRARGTST